MPHRKPKVGDVVQLSLPDGRFAYGRVLRGSGVAFYREMSDRPGEPPIGSTDFQFTVAVDVRILTSNDVPIVGHDPRVNEFEDWPPPAGVEDPIGVRHKVYFQGRMMVVSSLDEIRGLERAAVWDREDIVERLVTGSYVDPVPYGEMGTPWTWAKHPKGKDPR